MRFNIPPEYNKKGNRQLWFVETESGVDEIVNGAIHALVVIGVLLAGLSLLV